MINDSKSTTVGKSSFYAVRDSYYYLPLDADILKSIGSLSYPQRRWQNLGFVTHSTLGEGALTVKTRV